MEATPDQDALALNVLARWCIGYSPVVGLCPPDGIWIDIAGSSHLFGGEEQLVSDLLQRLNRQGIHAMASVADTPSAAWAMVRYGREIVVRPGETARAVENLPVDGLRLSPQTIERLHLLGIDRIGQLARMPRAPMARRFGKELLLCLDQLYGQEFETFDPLMAKEMPSQRLVFSEPIGRWKDLQDVLHRLTQLQHPF
jgi:protein ImuB